MDKYEFEQFLYKQIPITKSMGIRVLEFTPAKIRLAARLEPNKNDKGTAFGGSINSLMTLCGWAMVFINIKEAYSDAQIVVKKSTINYLSPITEDFVAECVLSDEGRKADFLESYGKYKKARLDIEVFCCNKDALAVKYEGQYVAYL